MTVAGRAKMSSTNREGNGCEKVSHRYRDSRRRKVSGRAGSTLSCVESNW